jgi:hypothetical protein
MDLSRNLSKFPAKVSPLNDFHKAFEILDNFLFKGICLDLSFKKNDHFSLAGHFCWFGNQVMT